MCCAHNNDSRRKSTGQSLSCSPLLRSKGGENPADKSMLSLLAARARRPRKPRIKSASAAAVAANFWPLFHEKEAFMAKNEGSLLDWTGSQQRSLNFLPKLRFAKFAPLLHTRSDSNNLGRLKEPWPYFCLSLFSLRRAHAPTDDRTSCKCTNLFSLGGPQRQTVRSSERRNGL